MRKKFFFSNLQKIISSLGEQRSTELLNQRAHGGFPGGSVGKNLPASTGNRGLIPDLGRISHASEQLRLWAVTAEPAL